MSTNNQVTIKRGFFWHVHHDKLMEYCYNYQKRMGYINKYKPENEQELRLRLFQPVQGELPTEIVEALLAYQTTYAACNSPWAGYEGLWAACDEAWFACREAIKKHEVEIKALHEQECPGCPWDGYTMFV